MTFSNTDSHTKLAYSLRDSYVLENSPSNYASSYAIDVLIKAAIKNCTSVRSAIIIEASNFDSIEALVEKFLRINNPEKECMYLYRKEKYIINKTFECRVQTNIPHSVADLNKQEMLQLVWQNSKLENDLTRTILENSEKFAEIQKDNDNLKLETDSIREINNKRVCRVE